MTLKFTIQALRSPRMTLNFTILVVLMKLIRKKVRKKSPRKILKYTIREENKSKNLEIDGTDDANDTPVPVEIYSE